MGCGGIVRRDLWGGIVRHGVTARLRGDLCGAGHDRPTRSNRGATLISDVHRLVNATAGGYRLWLTARYGRGGRLGDDGWVRRGVGKVIGAIREAAADGRPQVVAAGGFRVVVANTRPDIPTAFVLARFQDAIALIRAISAVAAAASPA